MDTRAFRGLRYVRGADRQGFAGGRRGDAPASRGDGAVRKPDMTAFRIPLNLELTHPSDRERLRDIGEMLCDFARRRGDTGVLFRDIESDILSLLGNIDNQQFYSEKRARCIAARLV